MTGDRADLEALWACGANRPVLEALQRGAMLGSPGNPYPVDEFRLRTHPDLTERLDELARGLPGGCPVGIFGFSALVRDGVAYAAAMGTGDLRLRLSGRGTIDEICAGWGSIDPELGPGWVGLGAWLSDIPRDEGTARLRRWVAAAAQEAPDSDA